ncbi:NAD-dependent epimerase/dehydratase family protein [Bradyrhizobium liaoningense]|uniref:NAD-dependent epimerase/dehydratase family protein n=1 Tax=Bradyrhizobium liaoningense TaxID=43992 RepID=UPI001BA51DA3|nr:NAD-dependent epimerase/dehydratase family protein [Bradyrhizobium liaoningense]MBR0705678.1 NAD(P)H-binding protein [Bradyrhizobium liaoningense]
MKTALLFGATGFIGSHLLRDLLNSPDYSRVIAVARKPLATSHPKLSVLIGDLASLPALKPQLVADEVFIALGTTRKHTPDEAEYYKIDHDYPLLAAEIAKANGAQSVFLVTAVGANTASSVFYVRTKGEVERDILALDFEHTHIFRPSQILGERDEDRPRERLIIAIWNVINPLLVGPADRYRGLTGNEIAHAIARAARHQAEKVRIYHWKEMTALLRT